MTLLRRFRVLAAVPTLSAIALAMTPLSSTAQSSPQAPPQIIASGVGEATIIPDRGMIYLSVETRAPTAAGAGAENARIQTAVIAALRAKGVLAEYMTTSGYSVGPDERYDNGQRQVVGYIARNSVVVDVQKIGQVGTYIDVALGAGANAVGGLRYYSTKYEAIRRTALESAVSRAKADAEVMARAAGGSLGTPIEISANDAGGPRPMFDSNVRMAAMAVAEGAETPVAVGEQKVTVSVTTRWTFVPAR
jgi:uncharacterized protein YggE